MAARDLALRLITKMGRNDGVLRRPSDGAVARPDRPWAPQDVALGHDPIIADSLPVVVLDIASYRKTMGPDAPVKPEATAVALIPAASVLEVRVNDTLESRSLRYVILATDLLAPGTEDVLHTLQLRG